MASKYDPDEIATALGDARMAAAANAAGSVDENPDEAARAIKLGQATGIHPLAIVGDDSFEPRHKAQLAAQVVNNNDALQRYINSHPLAARVSNDDWGGLDQASRSIEAVGDKSILGRFIDEFKEGFGDPQLGEWMYQHEPTRKLLEKYPGLAVWVAGVGGAVELPAKIFTGTLHGAHGAIEQGLMDAGMEPSSARKLAKDLTGFLEYKYMRPEAGAPGPSTVRRTYAPLKAEIQKLAKDNEAARPFLEAQVEPPYGLAKDTDAIKEDQLALDEKALDAAVKDFQSTATFARSPEMASIFAGVHPETKPEISANAIRRIYGDKEPAAEDGLFGGIPGFIERFHSAEEIGGGVEISLKDWLRLDKEVIKEIKEDVRHREGGVSKAEIEEGKEAAKLTASEPGGIEGEYISKDGKRWRIERTADGSYTAQGEVTKTAPGNEKFMQRIIEGEGLTKVKMPNGQALASVEKAAGLESKVMKAARAEEPPTGEPPEPPSGEAPLTEPIFGKGALGLPQTQVDRIQKLIDQKNRENMDRELKRAAKAEARKQSAQWKDDRKSMAAEVETEFYQKPEIAATQWLYDNKLGKAKTGKYTLDETKVTPEQRAALPDRLFAKSGRKLSPDELADKVGAGSGKELLEDLTSLHEAIGETPWRQAFREAVSAETDRRMQEKYGDLAANILEEAKDHALGLTQMDLLHEDTVAMGMLAEAEMPYSKSEVRMWIKGFTRDQLMSTLRADKFLQDTGRLGKLIEIALASRKFDAAFRTAQTREYNALMAREAKRVEKERDWFEGQAKRWRRAIKPDDPISGEAGDMVHALLIKAGFAVDRSVQQIQDSMTGHGWNSLRDFVEAKQGEGEVAQFPRQIFDAEPKAIKDMTYDEFKQVSDGLKGLLAYGKRAKKIFVGDREIDRLNARDEMLEAQSGFTTKSYRESAPKGWQRMKAKLKEIALLPVQPEFFFDRLDLGEKWGPHTQYMIRDLIDSGNNTWTKWRKFGRMFDELKRKIGDEGTDWHEAIPNSLIRNPDTGEALKITRSELRTVILNMGNPENFKKLTEGWKIDPLALKSWVKDHSTEKDWAWAAGVGQIFQQSGRESQRMWRRLYGTAWDFIDLPPVQTPFGDKPGWYVPLIKDAYFEKEYNSANKIYANKKSLFEYVHDRIATPDGHTKERTQSVYPLNLDVRMVPGRLRTMIYDTEMREAVLNFRSFSQDSEWRSSVRSKFGKHYLDMMDAYIKDVANWPIDNAEMIAGPNSIMSSLLRNIVTSLIAFNIGTPLKHGPTALALSMRTVGSKDFASSFRSVWLGSASKDIRKIIWEKSEEIQRRTRNYEESLFGSYIESTLGETKPIKAQRKFQETGAAAVAFSDRLSSEPTWWAEYNRTLNEGRSEGDAVYAANRAVRFAHGSTAITSRPAAMRGGPMSKMFTILYGFFNDMFNRSYKMAWQAKDTVTDAHDLFKAGEAKEGWTVASKGGRRFIGDLAVLGLFVGLVEEIVAPITSGKKDEEEGLGTILTKGTLHGLAGQVPFLREVVDGTLRGQVPQVGALGAAYRSWHDLYGDMSKTGERDLDDHLLHLGDYAQHITTALGMATGIGSRPVGNAIKYWYNVGQGLEEAPEGPWGAAVGTRFGTSKRHSRTLDEYTSHWLEKVGMQ